MSENEFVNAIKEAIYLINLESIDKGEPCYSLPDMLARKNVAALRNLGKLYDVKGYSKMNKALIIQALNTEMQEPFRLKHILSFCDEIEWDLFKSAAHAKAIIDNDLFCDNYRVLITLGLMCLYHHNNQFYYIVPEEIKKAYHKLELSGFPTEKERALLLNDYAIAAVNLYGVISQADFVSLFNSQNRKKTSIDEVSRTLMPFSSILQEFCLYGDYIVNYCFEDNNFADVDYYIQAADSKPRYLPDKNEFLKYRDWDYTEEKTAHMTLQSFIIQEITKDEDEAQDLLEDIYFLCKFQAKPELYFDLLEDYEYHLSYEKMQRFLQLLLELNNHTRLWVNNGYTPFEIHAEKRKHLRLVPSSRSSKEKSREDD